MPTALIKKLGKFRTVEVYRRDRNTLRPNSIYVKIIPSPGYGTESMYLELDEIEEINRLAKKVIEI